MVGEAQGWDDDKAQGAPAGSTSVAGSRRERPRASLVAQWLRVCLLMQGTRVRALVWEDPTCRGATGPMGHNC